jgi:amino acid transporter
LVLGASTGSDNSSNGLVLGASAKGNNDLNSATSQSDSGTITPVVAINMPPIPALPAAGGTPAQLAAASTVLGGFGATPWYWIILAILLLAAGGIYAYRRSKNSEFGS